MPPLLLRTHPTTTYTLTPPPGPLPHPIPPHPTPSNLAPFDGNRERYANELLPETIAAVLKTHLAAEVFAKEACRALVTCIASEEDEVRV